MIKIIVVDDDQLITESLSHFLQKEKYNVYTAENGSKGLDLIYKTKPDLIIMDIVMPVMNGVEVIKKVKTDARLKKIPIIVMTAIRDFTTIVQLKKMGVGEYIAKPFEMEDVLSRIKRTLPQESAPVQTEKPPVTAKKRETKLKEGELISYKLIYLDEAQPEMVLANDLRGSANQVLLSQGTVLSEGIIKKLKKLGIKSLEIKDQ
ncbi:MAG: response regulator [Spirochaetes bacterium]|nr:response regulator [Spirochaetota bacterium]